MDSSVVGIELKLCSEPGTHWWFLSTKRSMVMLSAPMHCIMQWFLTDDKYSAVTDIIIIFSLEHTSMINKTEHD